MSAELWLILPVLFFAAIVQGSTGFGFGLVSVGILTLFLPVQFAAGLNALPALTVNYLLLWRLRHYFHWKDLRGFAMAIIVATPIGVGALRLLNPQIMNAFLATVLAVAILQSCRGTSGKRKPWHAMWLGIPMGIFSGLLSGAYGTGGPPAVAYVQSYSYERHRHVVSIQVLLAVAGTIRAISLLSQGALSSEQWLINGLGMLVVPLGVWIGLHLLRRLPGVWLRRAILTMLVMTMCHCLRKSITPSTTQPLNTPVSINQSL
ncbi:sulfite exporter TauE/SafE family protein [Kiritimatiellota bacterium B12222]|nr:sulfite exporter TauE/SafE family protein [Kiritimatiellota bacterium B12222]